jgi:cell division protein FtsB
MKLVLILLASIYLLGCGAAEDLGRNCGGEMEMGCHTIFGGRHDNEQDKNIQNLADKLSEENLHIKNEIESIENEIETLKNNTLNNTAMIATINSVLPSLNDTAAISALQSQVTLIQASNVSLESRIEDLENDIGTPVTGLQSLVVQNNIQITQLINNHNITKIVDPCGDGPGFDEVLLKTSSGKVLASFSQSSSALSTRFSVLPPGTYTTTDGTSCTFTVSSTGSVTPSVEY